MNSRKFKNKNGKLLFSSRKFNVKNLIINSSRNKLNFNNYRNKILNINILNVIHRQQFNIT